MSERCTVKGRMRSHEKRYPGSHVPEEGEIWINAPGTYYIGYNSDDGAQLRIDTMAMFPWLSIVEDVTGSAVIATTVFPAPRPATQTVVCDLLRRIAF